MAPMVTVFRPSSLRPSSPPLRLRPPPDPPPPCLAFLVPFEAFSPQPCSSSLGQALSPPEPSDLPLCSSFPVPFEALSLPKPPDPPDASCRLVAHLHLDTPFTLSQEFFNIQNLETPCPNLASGGGASLVFFGVTRFDSKCLYPAVCNVVLAELLSGFVTALLPVTPSPPAHTHIPTRKPPSRMATKHGGGGLPVSASDVSLAYGLHYPVVYRSLFGCVHDTSFAYGLHSPVIYRSLFGCVDWHSISYCFDLPTSSPCKVLHAHLSFLSTYSAMVEWFRQLLVWVMLELRFTILNGDIPMDLVSFGSSFATSSNFYIALARASAVCSSLTRSIPDVDVVFVYLFSWWQVEEKFIVIFIPMNMDVAGYDFPVFPRLNQSSFLIFPPIWSELDEQVSLVLQGSSSHRIFSAYGAVCVVLRVALNAVFEEVYDVVVTRFHIAFSWDLYCHSILYVVVVFVYLAVNSLVVSSFVGE